MTAAVGATRASTGGGARGWIRRGLPLLLVALAIVVAALLAGPGQEGAPLDPRSTGPQGTRALLDTLTLLGVDVELEPQTLDDGVARALILIDDLTEDEEEEVRRWVADGGVLVVADPRSLFTPEVIGTAGFFGAGVTGADPACDVPALAGISEVLLGGGAATYELPSGAVGCFPRDDGFWLVAEPVGDGAVVSLGGPDMWINASLGSSGGAELAVALLADPAGGGLAVLRTRLPGGGDAALADLVGDNVRLFGLQLMIALLLVVAWRSRRLGRPVEEPQPVAIPGSELVTAVGNLLQESGSRARAADLLRAELRRTLEQRLGLPKGAAPEDLMAAVGARTGASPDALGRALTGGVPDDEAALVTLAHDIERLRSAALTSPAAADGPTMTHHDQQLTRRST